MKNHPSSDLSHLDIVGVAFSGYPDLQQRATPMATPARYNISTNPSISNLLLVAQARMEQRKKVAVDLRAIFNAPNCVEAERLLSAAVKKYSQAAPRLSEWLEANVYQGLTVISFPVEHQRRLRATNLNERVHCELNRRTRVVGIPERSRIEPAGDDGADGD